MTHHESDPRVPKVEKGERSRGTPVYDGRSDINEERGRDSKRDIFYRGHSFVTVQTDNFPDHVGLISTRPSVLRYFGGQ